MLQAGVYTIYGSLHTDLSEEAVLDVLTDYKGLSRIYNNIENSQVLLNGSEKQVIQVHLALLVPNNDWESGQQPIADSNQKGIDVSAIYERIERSLLFHNETISTEEYNTGNVLLKRSQERISSVQMYCMYADVQMGVPGLLRDL